MARFCLLIPGARVILEVFSLSEVLSVDYLTQIVGEGNETFYRDQKRQ